MNQLQIQKEQIKDESMTLFGSSLPQGMLCIDESIELRGLCSNFISHSQKTSRIPLLYEIATENHPHWEMIASHLRNCNYEPQYVRAPEALRDSYIFIVKEYLSQIENVFNQNQKRISLVNFIYDRIIAVRCEYHVQGILDPSIQLHLLKTLIYLQTLGNVPVRIVGLSNLLLPQVKKYLLTTPQLQQIFRKALTFSLASASRNELIQLMETHQSIIEKNDEMKRVLKMKNKIWQGNYRYYFKEIANKNIDVVLRMIYWKQYEKMKNHAIACYRKSQMNEKASILCKILCYKKMEGWVNISKKEQENKLEEYKVEYDLKIKLWVGEKILKQKLVLLVQEIKELQ